MPTPGFATTVVDQIIDLLKSNLGSAEFKQYFYGDPIAIPDTWLPCVVVAKKQSQYELGPTGMDQTYQTIVVKLVYDKKKEFGKSPTEVAGQRRLEELAEGVDNSTGETSQSSVVGILRKNFTLSALVENEMISVNYGVMPRPNDSVTEEAHITVNVDKLYTVTGRS